MDDGHKNAAARLRRMLSRVEGRELGDDVVLAQFLAESGFAVADAHGAEVAAQCLRRLAETIAAVDRSAFRDLAAAQLAGRA